MVPECTADGAMGRALDLQSTGCGFKYYSGQKLYNNLGQLFAPMCLCHQAVYNLVTAKGRWFFAAGKVMAVYRRVYDIRADCLYTGIISGPNAP